MMRLTGIDKLLRNVFPLIRPQNSKLFRMREDFSNYEGNMLSRELGDMNWDRLILAEQQAKMKTLFSENKLFPFLKPYGFVYYLPAFLIYMLKNHDGEFMQFCMFNMTPGDTKLSQNRVGEIYMLLNEEKISAVKVSLEAISEKWCDFGEDENMAKIALDGYWKYV